MKALSAMFVGALLFALTAQVFAQEVLREVIVTAENYKYLNAIEPEEAAQPVNMLEQYAASYDVRGAEFYEEEYESYIVSFFIAEGKILAAYKDGRIIRTAERFRNVALPKDVLKAVATRFPKWTVAKDVYRVTYLDTKGATTTRLYKLLLENGDKKMRVKLTERGEFL
jgi:hypothetical protein